MTRSIAGLSVGLTTGLALLALSSTSVLALEAAVAPNVSAATAIAAPPAAHITTPREAFGFDIGADYQLVNYTQWEAYLKTLASQSDRMKLVEIGKTSEGRTQYIAIVSTPQNLAHLDRYREIARRLARPRA